MDHAHSCVWGEGQELLLCHKLPLDISIDILRASEGYSFVGFGLSVFVSYVPDTTNYKRGNAMGPPWIHDLKSFAVKFFNRLSCVEDLVMDCGFCSLEINCSKGLFMISNILLPFPRRTDPAFWSCDKYARSLKKGGGTLS